jgi:hypothetical protein
MPGWIKQLNRCATAHTLAACVAATFLLTGGNAQALVLSYASADAGNNAFATDDDSFQTTFNVTTAGEVTLQTWSYAGGIAGHMPGVAGGGFTPVLSVFDSTGFLEASENGSNIYDPVSHPFGGSCGPSNQTDLSTGFCEDIFLKIGSLAIGNYTVVLTQYNNAPNGPTLVDGFSWTGTTDFTGAVNCGLPAGSMFRDANDCSQQRSADWAFEIVVPDAPTGVPEPASGAVLALGLALLLRRR